LIIKILKSYLLNVFDLKEHEIKKTLLLQLNIFLIITTLLIIKPTINSLFLSELTSEALPLGYVFTALIALIGSYLYNKTLERFPLNKVIEMTLIFSVLSLVIFGLAFRFNLARGFILYIPYTWVAIFGLLTASQFWILANLVYNARDAKRVFGFIGAGAISGGIFGGYLTSILANLLTAEGLLFVAAFLLFFCLPITRYIWKNEVMKLNEFQVSKRTEPKATSPFKLIKKSKLLSHIAIVMGISVLVAKLIDYQYSDYASRFFEDPDELASFFGFWFSTLSVISLLIQLFLTPRVVGTFGIGNSLLWMPAGIFFGSVLLLFIPELWVIIMIKLAEGSLKQSVNKAATELLSIPVPIEIKKRTKTFTDVVIDSIATGLAGIILFFIINGLDISSTLVSLFVIALVMVWVFFIFKLRKEYIVAFKNLLEITSDKKEKQPKIEVPITSILNTVKHVLEQGSTNQVIHMLRKTLDVKDERFFKYIKPLLMHISPEVRILAIQNLYYLTTENLSKEMELLIWDSNQEVTTAAFHYLAKHYYGDTYQLIDKYLNDTDLTVSNAALIMLAEEFRHRPKKYRNEKLSNAIQLAIDGIDKLTTPVVRDNRIKAVLSAIGHSRLDKYYPFLLKHLQTSDLPIRNAALKSMANTLEPDLIKTILKHVINKETRQTVIEGLYQFGEPIIDILFHHIKDEGISPEEGLHSIAVIERFANQKSINVLLKLIDETDHMIEIAAIEALKRMKWADNNLEVNDRFVVDKVLAECQVYQNTLSVIHSQIVLTHKSLGQSEEKTELVEARNGLMNLMEHRLDRQLQRIFKLLGIKYPPEDIDPIFHNIIFGEEEQRINAIEFLDNIIQSPLKRELIPVAESIITGVNSEDNFKKLNLKMLSETECFRILLERKDVKLKMAVLYLIEQTNNPKLKPLLEFAMKDTVEKVRNRAREIIHKYES
jgi:ATP:ADP antiporter, AAA family